MLEYIIIGGVVLAVAGGVVFFVLNKKKDKDKDDGTLKKWESLSIEANGVKITATDYNAGAITSVKWNKKEFINDTDHGRQLQSASFFDGKGTYLNPTEAGSNYRIDGHNPHPSSSKLLAWSNKENVLATRTNMAYWREVDGQISSGHILDKRVQIGAFGHPTAIKYITSFTLPHTNFTSAMFEVVTGYMPLEFGSFYLLNPANCSIHRTEAPLDDGNTNEQGLPVIASTSNGFHAMGAVSRGLPQKNYPKLGYGKFRFPTGIDCVKWNNTFRYSGKMSKSYQFESYVAVGTLDQVRKILCDIYNKIN